jgi:hypothetical protein
MGYSEVCCQLCGTSFNIGRVRKHGEPLSAAFSWAEQGFYPEANFVTKESIRRDRCPPEAGCSNMKTARRCKLEGRIRVKAEVPDMWLVRDGDDEDMGWKYQSDEDEEALEWEEDCDDLDCADADDEDIINPGQDASKQLVQESSNAMNTKIATDVADEESLEGDSDGGDGDDEFFNRYHKCRLLEHIAGPGCIHHRGYNGHNISAEEMVGSGTVQCLIRKLSGWQHEATDEDWEVTGDYFLSGLGGHMQSRDCGGVKCLPIRHGIEEELCPDDEYWDNQQLNEWDSPMPFHPACIEVFKRVSHQRFGIFNANGLGRWRWAEAHYAGNPINRRLDPVLNRGLQQEWYHENGDEWLAANPVLVPALPRVLRPAIIEDEALFSEKDSAFSAIRTTRPEITPELVQDPFDTLPRELVNLIITHLESPDIAALRLSSRVFTHLPIFLWKQLLLKEMPWLWEIWDNSDTSHWALISSSELHEEDKRLRKVADELRETQELHKHVIKQEMPEYYNQYCAEHPWVLEDVNAAIDPALVQGVAEMAQSDLICRLPRDRTNWFVVYTQITRHWRSLKGLRNRERIWKSCEDIVQRIQRCIDEGKIVA